MAFKNKSKSANANLCNEPYNKEFVIDSACTPNHLTKNFLNLDRVKAYTSNISVAKKDQTIKKTATSRLSTDQYCVKNEL